MTTTMPAPAVEAPTRGGDALTVKDTYNSVHYHLEKQRGRAKDQPCAFCGDSDAVHDWAYLYNAGDAELTCPVRGRKFATDIWNNYAPLCRTCHKNFDMEHEPRIREATSRTGKIIGSMPKSPEWTANVWASRKQKLADDPGAAQEYHERYSGTMARTNSALYQCGGCDMQTNAGNMGKHHRKSGHTGKTAL